MRLQENPFYILGVTPEHSIAEIDEVKEDKCFEDETREAEYEEARDILANPRKRIYAEVRWFGEKNTQVFAAIDSLYVVRDEHLMKEIPQRIRDIDSVYAKYANPEAASFLLYEVNAGRKKARIAEINEENIAVDALREAMAEDFRAAAAVFCGQISLENLVEIANTLAEEVIRPSIGIFPKKYSEIVQIFIDLYHAQTQSRLEDDCRKVLDAIEAAKDAEEKLGFAYTAIRNFEKIAKPLQIYFRDIGQVKHQTETQEVEGALRSLAVYYNNEKGMPDVSLSITEFCLEIFNEDLGFVKILQADKLVLIQMFQERRGDSQGNKSAIWRREKSWIKEIGVWNICYILFIIVLAVLHSEFSRPQVLEESKQSVSSSVKKDADTAKKHLVVPNEEEIRHTDSPVGKEIKSKAETEEERRARIDRVMNGEETVTPKIEHVVPSRFYDKDGKEISATELARGANYEGKKSNQ